MAEDSGGLVLQHLDAIDGKLNTMAREQRETTERIRAVQRSQAEIKNAIRDVSAAVSTTHARMTDMARTAQQLRTDFEAFREQVDARFANLAALTNTMSSNVVRVLEVVEREELQRMQQLQLRNVVQDAAELVGALKDRVVRYMAAMRLQALFDQHQLVVRSFDEIPDREYFEETVTKIRQAVADVTDVDREEIRQYEEASNASLMSQKWLDELSARETAVQTRDKVDHERAEALRSEAAEIRRNALAREAAARRAARCAFLISGALLLAAAGLGSFSFQDTSDVTVVLSVGFVLVGVYGLVRLQYSAAAHAARCDAKAAQLQAVIYRHENEFVEWQRRVREALGDQVPGGNNDLPALRVALNERRDASNRVRDAFARKHPDLRLIA